MLDPSTLGGLAEELERLAPLVDRDVARPARWRGPIRREYERGWQSPDERAALASAFDRWIPAAVGGSPISPGILMMMHRTLTGDETGYRSGLVRVGSRELPPENVPRARDVPGLVDASLARAAGSFEPLPLVAARLHLELLLIHPFSDGNGRAARLAASYALASAGYRSTLITAAEQHFRADPEAYALAFGALRAGDFVDHDGWLEVALRAAVGRVKFACWWKAEGEPELADARQLRRWRRRHPRNAEELDRQVRRLRAEEADMVAMPA